MGKSKSQLSKRSNSSILALNDNREDAFWQEERGSRYGHRRKGEAKKKVQARRTERRENKNNCRNEEDIC